MTARIVCLFLLAFAGSLSADVKLRPGDKSRETSKDFQKDIKKNGYPTPEPRDRTFNFTTGLSVDIELDVATSYLGTLKFMIRETPKFGHLSEIRPHPSGESNKAIVTYTHNGDPEALNDRFTFSAKIGEGNTSAPGTITLVGKKSAPRIEVLEATQFRRLEPGKQDAAKFVIVNSGTAAFSADVTWPEPFTGPPHLDLAINEKQTFMLLVKPMKTGAYRVNQYLQPGVETSRVQAYVECVQAFSASPGAVMLAFDPAKSQRSGKVSISNASIGTLTLKLEAPNRLHIPSEITIAPNTRQELEIFLDAHDVDTFRGELWVIQEPHREKVVVQADAEPPQIRLVAPAQPKIDFGKVEKGKKGEASISIANDGGKPAFLNILSLPSPFSLSGGDSPAVQPGKTLELTVTFAPDQGGDYKGVLGIGGNGGQLDIALSGSMFDPKKPTAAAAVENPHTPARPTKTTGPAPSRPTKETGPAASVPASLAFVPPASNDSPPAKPDSTPAPTATKQAKEPAAANANGELSPLERFRRMSDSAIQLQTFAATYGLTPETSPQFKSTILDPVPSIAITGGGSDWVEISWGAPKVAPKEYLLQRSGYRVNKTTGLPLKFWDTIKDWKQVKSSAGQTTARITDLKPEQEYEWRVIGVDHEGKFSPSSDILRFVMPPVEPIASWVWLLIVGAGLLAGVVIFRRLREQRELAI